MHSIGKGGMAVNEMEQRVWQRVMGEKEPENTDLRQLAITSQEAVAEYRQLLRSKVESHRDLGKKLLSGEQENLACLKGLHQLQTGNSMKLPILQPKSVDVKTLVRRYHSARRCMAEYTARSAEAEWGCVFLAMARRQEMQCALLAQLLGHMK